MTEEKTKVWIQILLTVLTILSLINLFVILVMAPTLKDTIMLIGDGRWVCERWEKGDDYLSRGIIDNWVLYQIEFAKYNADVGLENITDYGVVVTIYEHQNDTVGERIIRYTKNDCINEIWVR